MKPDPITAKNPSGRDRLRLVHSFGLGDGWPICALRPTGIYGPAHPPSASRWFADAKAITGQAFNCCDRYIAEQEVARIAQELTGSSSTIAKLNRGPKNVIVTEKLRALGIHFGGEALVRQTVQQLVAAHRSSPA